MTKAERTTRENLGVRDDTRQDIIKRVSEKILLEENTTIVSDNTYGNAWIVGSSTNGIVGTNTGTQGGGQQVVGGSGRTETVLYVINVNNTFREHFADTSFNDSGNTTATWSGNGQISFTSSEIAQSTTIAKHDFTITTATLSLDDDTNLTLELSADGGSNWETVTNNVEHSFTNTGTDLRFKLTASGSSTVTFLKVVYQ